MWYICVHIYLFLMKYIFSVNVTIILLQADPLISFGRCPDFFYCSSHPFPLFISSKHFFSYPITLFHLLLHFFRLLSHFSFSSYTCFISLFFKIFLAQELAFRFRFILGLVVSLICLAAFPIARNEKLEQIHLTHFYRCIL